jgi:TatA/E family protein of Tat protein translocase
MFGLGAGEILIILFFALIFIGPKKLPELAKNLGKGIRDFQNALKGIPTNEDDDDDEVVVEAEPKTLSNDEKIAETKPPSESESTIPPKNIKD